MLKNILKLEGVKKLTKSEQRNVKGGACCDPELYCCKYCVVNGCQYGWSWQCGGGCV